MATGFRTLDELPADLTGKRVLVRVDLNVPMDGASVSDDTRLRALLPTVLELSGKGALVLLLSHFGRPKGEVRPDMSTAQLVMPLARLTGRSVRFIEDCQGPEAARAVTQHPAHPLSRAWTQTAALARLQAEQEQIIREIETSERMAAQSDKRQRIGPNR